MKIFEFLKRNKLKSLNVYFLGIIEINIYYN